MLVNQDPILQALKEIQAKQDVTIAKQETARTNGAVAGAVSGGLVATGITLIKAKFGI